MSVMLSPTKQYEYTRLGMKKSVQTFGVLWALSIKLALLQRMGALPLMDWSESSQPPPPLLPHQDGAVGHSHKTPKAVFVHVRYTGKPKICSHRKAGRTRG